MRSDPVSWHIDRCSDLQIVWMASRRRRTWFGPRPDVLPNNRRSWALTLAVVQNPHVAGAAEIAGRACDLRTRLDQPLQDAAHSPDAWAGFPSRVIFSCRRDRDERCRRRPLTMWVSGTGSLRLTMPDSELSRNVEGVLFVSAPAR